MDKKLKKKLLLERNKRHQIINQHAEQHAQNAEILKEERRRSYDALHPDSTATDEVVWSAKTQEIRDRLTGKKRAARERWNRYAGTSDGGGRGR